MKRRLGTHESHASPWSADAFGEELANAVGIRVDVARGVRPLHAVKRQDLAPTDKHQGCTCV